MWKIYGELIFCLIDHRKDVVDEHYFRMWLKIGAWTLVSFRLSNDDFWHL